MAPDRAPISFFWPRNTSRVLTAPLPVFSILGNSSSGPTRTQLEIRKDREISTRDIESYGRSMFFGSSGQFLRTNETRNDNHHRIEVLRDHIYLCMLLFSLCTAVFDSRLLFKSDFFCALYFSLKKVVQK